MTKKRKDIKVLEQEIFKILEILVLSWNKIPNIDIFDNINFKELKVLEKGNWKN